MPCQLQPRHKYIRLAMQRVKMMKVKLKLTGPDGDGDNEEEGRWREAAEEHDKASGAKGRGRVREAEEGKETRGAGEDSSLESSWVKVEQCRHKCWTCSTEDRRERNGR